MSVDALALSAAPLLQEFEISHDGVDACVCTGARVTQSAERVSPNRQRAIAVSGGVPFTAITVGPDHACARTTTGVAFCWGSNADGQVGTGAAGGVVDVPTAIGGTLRLARIDAGGTHTCGLRGNGEAHCWGTGAIGIGTGTAAAAPTRVSTELRFASISAGEDRTCAATTGGATYCWGERFTAGGTPPDPLKSARIPLLGAP